MIKGFSFIWGTGVFHCGKYIKGTWFDSHEVENPSTWGIKIDMAIGKIIRPVPYFWRLGFWKKDKPVIQNILDEGEVFAKDYFGEKLYSEIIKLDSHHWTKRTVYNPWYALHSFVLRLPVFVWPFMSIVTPWISFYVGCRSFQVDPFTRDATWCGIKEEFLAMRDPPIDRFFALSPSVSIRNSLKR